MKLNGHRNGFNPFDLSSNVPPGAVLWRLYDRRRPDHFVEEHAQTAYEAYRRSNIQRDGVPLPFSEVECVQRKDGV